MFYATEAKQIVIFKNSAEGWFQPNLNSKDSIYGAGPAGCTGSLDGPYVGHILSTLWEEEGLCAPVEAMGSCAAAQ